MVNQYKGSSQNTWVGILLVVVGLLFLMDTLDILNVGSTFAHWWPLILILIGFAKLKGQDKAKGTIFFIVGVVFLSATLNIINWGNIFRFWPLILIAIGAVMILKRKDELLGERVSSGGVSGDFIRANAIFGGAERIVTSQNLKGGDVMALFGGVDLDLRQARVSPEGCNFTLTALFGGVEVIVPPDWNVSDSGMPIFGGIENKTAAGGEKTGGKAHFTCTVAFGGIEIKN